MKEGGGKKRKEIHAYRPIVGVDLAGRHLPRPAWRAWNSSWNYLLGHIFFSLSLVFVLLFPFFHLCCVAVVFFVVVWVFVGVVVVAVVVAVVGL